MQFDDSIATSTNTLGNVSANVSLPIEDETDEPINEQDQKQGETVRASPTINIESF